MERLFDFMNSKLDINGDLIFNGLDLALWPIWILVMYVIFWRLPKATRK